MTEDRAAQPVLRVESGGKEIVLSLSGRLDDSSVAGCWNAAVASARNGADVRVECAAVDYCGGAGLALLVALEDAAKQSGARFVVQVLPPRFDGLYR